MFSFQGTIRICKRFNEIPTCWSELQSVSWWRLAGSNRWPPACKAGALPAELNPHIQFFKWWARTRFSAEKPRRLQQSTGLLPSAAFRVHFGFLPPRTLLRQSWLPPGSLFKLWAKMDSNHRPHDYQSCALASWAIGPYSAPLISRYISMYPLNWITLRRSIHCSLYWP